LSDHFAELSAWLPLPILLASLAGSPHCVGMCGGLIAAIAHEPRCALRYHLGRLLGYGALGALAGGVGGAALSGALGTTVSRVSIVFLAATLVGLGCAAWTGRPLHWPLLPKTFLSRLFRVSAGSPLTSGAVSALLPCGWLHSFVLAAAASGGAGRGAMTLGVFWLGTLPALATGGWALERLLKPLLRRSPRLAGALLVGAGLVSLGMMVAHLGGTHSGAAHGNGHHSSAGTQAIGTSGKPGPAPSEGPPEHQHHEHRHHGH
jgi:hypothetical protein